MLRTDGRFADACRNGAWKSLNHTGFCMPLPRVRRPSPLLSSLSGSVLLSNISLYFHCKCRSRHRTLRRPSLRTRPSTSPNSTTHLGSAFSALPSLTTEIQTGLRCGWARRSSPHGLPTFSTANTTPSSHCLEGAPECSS